MLEVFFSLSIIRPHITMHVETIATSGWTMNDVPAFLYNAPHPAKL